MPLTIWGPWENVPAGPALDQLFAEFGSESARIYLLGGRPGGAGGAEMQEWFRGHGPPEGWQRDYREHPTYPVLTYKRGRKYVEFRRAASWFPEPTSADECARAFQQLWELLDKHFDGAVPLATPALTGKNLWHRTTKFDFPPLDSEVRELIHSTTGQGRIQIVEAPKGTPDKIPALFHLDARFAYGAIGGDGFPVQLLSHDRGADFLHYTPARYRLTFVAPNSWRHVGIFGVWNGERWTYPLTGECWADACEVMLAIKHGWRVKILERLVFSPGGVRPLETWRTKLVALYERVRDPLVAYALRAIVLHTIGAFATRAGSQVTVVRKGDELPAIDPAAVLSELEVGDSWHITTRRELDEWSQRFQHPEWSAYIWARMRCRVLEGPGGTGVLNLPPGHVLAIETDGLYLTHNPGWKETGRIGEFRVKGYTPGPLERPRTWEQIHAQRARGK